VFWHEPCIALARVAREQQLTAQAVELQLPAAVGIRHKCAPPMSVIAVGGLARGSAQPVADVKAVTLPAALGDVAVGVLGIGVLNHAGIAPLLASDTPRALGHIGPQR